MVRSMLLHLVMLSNCILGQVAAQQAERRPTSDSELTIHEVVEKAMHMGHFAQGETLLQNALTENPDDERARFQLGILQFLRAIENLGQSLYEHGAVSAEARQPFLRLPVPHNPDPATISYRDVQRILDLLGFELRRAEATLAEIDDDAVIAPLRLAPIKLDFINGKTPPTSLLKIMEQFNGRQLAFADDNPDFLVHFDRGDVAWLRAYCHLLCGMLEGYLAIDGEIGFEDRVAGIFPKIQPSTREEPEDWYQYLPIVDGPRLRRMRLHFIAVCDLNKETWQHIRGEKDDSFEWLPHPKQTDQLGVPITDDQIDAWLSMMKELRRLFNGDTLINSAWLQYVHDDHPDGLGLNLAKVLDNPPDDLLHWDRIQEKGITPDFLEAEAGKAHFDFLIVLRVASAFNGPFGFFSAIRMN
jgi:hypothetical protein